ncbi:MAG TPA: FAD-dependent oxidoreductase [Thermoleophilia bacterium]|nr:FAD-dependent oxidoreductase [Thermoleophilia bacterium]
MIEITIYGRGGRGGVTLAKLIAAAYFLRGKHVQAFGVYGAERAGAPVQAYVRVDDDEIADHWPVREPDYVIVLDSGLITPETSRGMDPQGWIVVNSPLPPDAFASVFPGRNVATLDASAIAVDRGLGTRALPIVNTALLGAAAEILGLSLADAEAALENLGLGEPNVSAARTAYEGVRQARLPGIVAPHLPPRPPARTASIFDEDIGGPPAVHTGSWATRLPASASLTPLCSDACPAGNDVRGFVQAMAQRDYEAALRTILATSPFPGTCGRVCPAPCMRTCARGGHDEAVNTRELERYVAAHASWPAPTRPFRREHMAVIGSGPAGLSAAYQLARLGYPVTVFEEGDEVGGLLRTGIPAYRLPRAVIDDEVAFILAHGVQVRSGQRVSGPQLVEMRREYDGVVVATGLQERRRMDLDGGAQCVQQALDFLDLSRTRPPDLRGQRVVVAGGGNTAIDAARVALRLGAQDALVVYRRTRAEMPAIAEEIEEALAEGVRIEQLAAPLRLEEAGDAAALVCRRMTLGEPDESGRPRPVPVEGDEGLAEFRCDTVLLALGQAPDGRLLPAGSVLDEEELLPGAEDAPACTAGDLAGSEGTVAAAIGGGRRAAWRLHAALGGVEAPSLPAPLVDASLLTFRDVPHVAMAKGRLRRPSSRRASFLEVRRGLSDRSGQETAYEEAQRCFSCGACSACGDCVVYCPEGILRHVGTTDCDVDEDYCKGCGLCVAQCPRSALAMLPT